MKNQHLNNPKHSEVCWVNDQEWASTTLPMSLLNWLRDSQAALDVRAGCDSGHCGSCAVLLDGTAVKACSVWAPEAKGQRLYSLQGLSLLKEPVVQAVVRAEQELQPFQCGYCKPAFMLAAVELLRLQAQPTVAQIKQQFSGLLCRCTGYQSIVAMVLAAANYLDCDVGHLPKGEN